jgi:hypothetical protein
MISCDAIPHTFDTFVQVCTAIAALNLLVSAQFDGADLVKTLMQMLGLPESFADIVYLVFAVCGGFVLICRMTGIPQRCKLTRIPGKSLVPIVVSSNGDTSALSAKAIVAAKNAETVAKQAADDAKVATKTVIDAIKNSDDLSKASDLASEAAKQAVIASKAVTIAKRAASIPLVAFVDGPGVLRTSPL